MFPILTPGAALGLLLGVLAGMHLQAYMHAKGKGIIRYRSLIVPRKPPLPTKRRGSRNRKRR